VQVDAPADLLGAPAGDFATAFVGSDRGLRRLEVTPVDVGHLVELARADATTDRAAVLARIDGSLPAVAVVLDEAGHLQGYRRGDHDHDHDTGVLPPPPSIVAGQASLKEAMSALLLADDGWLPVADDQGRYLGALTPDAIHRATRASLADPPVSDGSGR
jgi:osmoprotectant transport system ATP-binding protein